MTDNTGSSLQARALNTARGVFDWLRKHPLVWSGAGFGLAVVAFIVFQASVIPGLTLWIDELFTLWAGDARLPFPEAFATRILPDTNGPIYFSLIHLMQQMGLHERAAFIVLNFSVIGALLALVIVRGWTSGLKATTLSAVALVLLSAPLLVYAPEGRVYGMAMALCVALAFESGRGLASTAIKRNDLILAGVLGALAGWMHVYGAVFAGSLAAALVVVGWLLLRRRDIILLGLVLGAATSLAFLFWIIFAFPLFTGTTSWILFTPQWVFDAIWTLKTYVVGPTLGVAVALAFVGLSLALRHSRPAAAVLAITGGLFIAIPFAVSFKMPIFLGRYLLVAVPALLVLSAFVLRSHLVADTAPRFLRSGAAWLGVAFLAFPMAQGLPLANYMFSERAGWRGQEIVVPAIAHCPAGEIRAYSSVNLPFGFDYYLQGRLKLVFTPDAPVRDVSTIDCPVYGWAEHVVDDPLGGKWYETVDMARVLESFRLTNTTGVPLEIIRHRGGLVLARADVTRD